MGRKVEMKRIEDVTRCQVTYSKRRSSLMKKANEISVCCDVDVAFIAFSPSGRLSKFCSQDRIETVLERFIKLSPDKRYNHIKNLEEKQGRLNQLHHINGDHNKLLHLNNHAEQIQLEITKARLELQLVEANLRDFEPGAQKDPSLARVLWCERNLKNSLKRVVSRKKSLLSSFYSSFGQSGNVQTYYQVGMEDQKGGISSYSNSSSGKEQNPCANPLLLQLDPWISPYSARVRENILQNIRNQAKETPLNKPLAPLIYTTPPQGKVGHDASDLLQFPAQTLANHGSIQSPKNDVMAMNIHYNSNLPMEANWLLGANQNLGQTVDPFMQRFPSPPMYETLFNTTAISASNSNCSNYYWTTTEQHQSVLVQADMPSQESLQGSAFPTNTPVEAVTGNNTMWTGGSQEGCSSWMWEGPDGFVMPESLNLEDFDIPL